MIIKEFDMIGKKILDEYGVIFVFEKEYNFLGVMCISVNEEVVYGILGDWVLKDGDLVNVDVFVVFDGYYLDIGILFVIGKDEEKEKLC